MVRRRPTPRNTARVVELAVRASLARQAHKRVLLKDPIAFFSAEWIAAEFDADVIVLVRHPAAFASSLKRLDWQFDFRNLTAQRRLLDGLLEPFRHELLAIADGHLDVIDQAILLWRVINATAHRYRERFPSWTIIRYEDVAAEPHHRLQQLYRRHGLTWSTLVADKVEHYTTHADTRDVGEGNRGGIVRDSRAAVWTWTQRLDAEEIERVRSGTADVADHWYTADDWSPCVG